MFPLYRYISLRSVTLTVPLTRSSINYILNGGAVAQFSLM